MRSPISLSLLLLVVTGTGAACRLPAAQQGNTSGPSILSFSGLNESFGDYWYQGAAEITTYDLEQARYGEIHVGSAVTIFVTEDFSRTKQVKLDDPYATPDDAVKVLKLNATREFNTGIYPYSIMTSVFTPVYRDTDPATVKLTASVQEWCGQTFVQMNRSDDGYRVRHFSYFEQDGDGDDQLEDAILEDELWNIIRLNPNDLPTGSIRIVSGAVHHRLAHRAWQPIQASASLHPSIADSSLMDYRVEYPTEGRDLLIRYRIDFPHEIEYWQETQQGRDTRDPLVTRATLKRRMMIDYWTRNRPSDVELREELSLDV